MLVNRGSESAVKAVTDLYKASSIEGRLAILGSLKPGSEMPPESSAWQPLLTQVATANDARLRRAAAEALAAQPAKVAAAVVGPLLSDEDAETRSQAAGVVLSIIGGERVVTSGSHGSSLIQINEEISSSAFPAGRKANVTNAPPAKPEQIAAWHTVLQQKAGAMPDVVNAAAIYVTGQSNADLPVLHGALDRADKDSLARLGRSAALAAILPRLPWPEGKPVAESLCRSPALFLRMVSYANKAAAGLRQFVFEPKRFRAAVEPASSEELQASMPQLLSANQKQVSLVAGTWRMEPVVMALLDATNAAWRAAAVYAIGSWTDTEGLPQLERATKDTNGWVRAAAIPGLTRASKDRATLEKRIGPLLADPDKHVMTKASLALLEPETRSAAGLDYSFEFFQFENIHAFPEFHPQAGEQRPPAPLEGKPAFLEQARRQVSESTPQEAALPALLLAQYGDFSGLDHLLSTAAGDSQKQDELGTVLLTAVALSRDAKYLPALKKMTATAKQNYELTRLLQAIKGMSGPEVRELRLEINKRLRETSE